MAHQITKENKNYLRLQQLILRIGTPALRDYFDKLPYFSPENLENTLNRYKGLLVKLKKRGDESQLDKLFPISDTVRSEDFDLTLLVKLLRNCGNLGEPNNFDWDKLPTNKEKEIFHDIARLKWYRNKYAHTSRPTDVTDENYLKDSRDLEDASLRIAPESERPRYNDLIIKIQTEPMDYSDIDGRFDQVHDDIIDVKTDINKLNKKVDGHTQEIKRSISKCENTERQRLNSSDWSIYYSDHIKKVYMKQLQQSKVEHLHPILPIEISPSQANPSLDRICTTEDISEILKEGNNQDELPILIEAEAGAGKTTLLQNLSHKWAQDSCKVLNRFTMVFLIPIRNVKSFELEDIICEDLGLLPRDEKHDLKRFLNLRSSEVLYLLDGLDEKRLDDTNAIFKIISEAKQSVICTTRPNFTDIEEMPYGIKYSINFKLCGFSDTNVKTFVLGYFQKEHDGGQSIFENLLIQCRKHLFGKALLKIPLYTNLMCELWGKDNEGFPETATELFSSFLKRLLTIYWQKMSFMRETEQIEFGRSPLESSVPPELRRILVSIASLGYHTLMKDMPIFTTLEVDANNLRMEEVKMSGLFVVESQDAISFRHKLFHEYFAGLMMSNETVTLTAVLSQELTKMRDDKLHHAFFFAAGLSDQASEVLKEEIIKQWKQLRCSKKWFGFFLWQRKHKKHSPNKRHKFAVLASFENQTLFESKSECIDDLRGGFLNALPVFCSSTHSMVAALNTMRKRGKKMENKNITLVDNKDINLEHMICVLQECCKTVAFTSVSIINAERHLCDEMMKLDWPHVTAIGFYKCDESISEENLKNRFSNLEHVYYDLRTKLTRRKSRIPQLILSFVDNLAQAGKDSYIGFRKRTILFFVLLAVILAISFPYIFVFGLVLFFIGLLYFVCKVVHVDLCRFY